MTGQAPPEAFHNYQGLCWWCGKLADSKEHRHKRTDVARIFKDGGKDGRVARGVGGSDHLQFIQSENSDNLKFSNVLCSACNNTRSQPFDKAYAEFSRYFHQNEDAIALRGSFQLSAIYGREWRDRRRLLTKYFVKHIGCRMAEDRVPIPEAVVDFLNISKAPLPHLQLGMGINLAKHEMEIHLRDFHGIDGRGSWVGDHGCHYSSHSGRIIQTFGHLGFDSFTLSYQCILDDKHGGENYFHGNKVTLDSFWPDGFEPGSGAEMCDECKTGAKFQD
ncbi:hypothetical protein GCM10010441_05520 [Kitasatospora paracochleata]